VDIGVFNIIILEDNTELRQGLEDHLSQEGFRVAAIEDGERLSEAINANKPDAILVDLNLPHEDGIDIIKRLKRAYPLLGVVVLTARVRSMDRKQAYDAGADVFLTKPAGADEVSTVLKSVCRRVAPLGQDKDWVLDLQAHRIIPPGGHGIDLTGRECLLLHELALSAHLLSFNRLFEVLGDADVPEQVNKIRIEQLISRVRQKLAPTWGGGASIKVLRSNGYRLCIAVRVEA
jgi:DNA-binding response OmpR family regulator